MDADNIDGHAEQARHFNIDPRYTYHVEATARVAGCEPWSCIDDRTYDGAPDGNNMIGWGKTKEEAKADLVRLFEERADYQEEMAMAEAQRRVECPYTEAEIQRAQDNLELLFGFNEKDLG